jgi:hypothetical protein
VTRAGWFTLAWAVWVLFFVVVEGLALLERGNGYTFSEHWWRVWRVREAVPLWLKVVISVVQVAAGVWLVGHLAFGLWSL